MSSSDRDVKAIHLEGGNYFDDMRIDIAESHRRFDNLTRNVRSIRRPRYKNIIKFHLTRISTLLGIQELLVVNGISRRWLNNFRRYWSIILNGRPFWTTLDFFMLVHDYRKRQQHTSQLEWDDPARHVSNWQQPNQIYATLHHVSRCATQPIVSPSLWKKLSDDMQILEYGCSLAPYYYCYREFFSHLNCNWILADIPNFPFHYAKFLYRDDSNVELVTINASDFENPLGERGDFDVIILTTVLEHLDNPVFVSKYLLNKLKPDGLFIFDYIKSEGKGLDHPKALEMRQACLENILAQTQIIYGNVEDISGSIGFCIARKKTA